MNPITLKRLKPEPADLPRVVGASQATAVVVGTIIGSGIFWFRAR